MKLARLPKKLRVMMSWTLGLFFGTEIAQRLTAHDVEALGEMLAQTRARAKQSMEVPAPYALDSIAPHQR